MSEVRLRFAPSPTGYVHIGGLRTALYNYLYAKQNNGKFILRIEDTDRTRYVEGALENLINELHWAGISWDEGVIMKNGEVADMGDFGPYMQSHRVGLGIYNKYVEKLLGSGHAYYCFCSKDRLEHVKDQQKADGKMPKYDGLCRGISLDEAKQRIANGEEHVIRLKLPANHDIEFEDVIKGKISINTDDMDDQVLIKGDGFPTYHLAVVVDDHLMRVTHVIRGDEWLPSTPKHIYLYEAFGWQAPVYVHLPTVLDRSGKKLSKRNDDAAVEDFRKQGYLPQGLVNYLALVGWSPESNKEILSMEDLISQFSFSRVSNNGGIFDKNKLDWVNGHYIKAMSMDDLSKLVKPYLLEAGFISQDITDQKMRLITATFQESIAKLYDIVPQSAFLFANKVEMIEKEAMDYASLSHVPELIWAFREELAVAEEVDQAFAQTVMKRIQKKTGIKGKNLFMPVRAILTGNVHGPELVNIIQILGKEEILKRLEQFEGKNE